MSGDELGGAVRAAAEAEADEQCLRRGSGVLGVVLLITDYREQRLDQIGRWWLVEEMRNPPLLPTAADSELDEMEEEL